MQHKKKTTISVYKTTIQLLKKQKITKRESYDEIIKRILKGEKK